MSACSSPAEFPWEKSQVDDLVLLYALACNTLSLVDRYYAAAEETKKIRIALATLDGVIRHAKTELVRYECACHGACPCHRS